MMKKLLADITAVVFDDELSQAKAEIERLQQHLNGTRSELSRHQDQISQLKQTISRLEDANRQLELEINELKITKKQKASTVATRAATTRHKKNTGGWLRSDINALRKLQGLSISELSVMFTDYSTDDIQDMLSRIRSGEV